MKIQIGISLRQSVKKAAGLTLLELLVVLVIIGVLSAIAAPSLNFLLNTTHLNIAQDQIVQALQVTKNRANRSHTTQQFSIRETNGIVQWAIHAEDIVPGNAGWREFDERIRLDPETTLLEKRGIHQVQFNHKGHINGQLGRITFSAKSGGRLKRCVVVSTLLGHMRTASNRPRPRDGKYCD